MSMNAEWKTKWVEALRSGDYEQGTDYLRYGDKFCCLGVLTDLVMKETAGAGWSETQYPQLEDQICGGTGALPDFVMEEVGLDAANPRIDGNPLSSWNDDKGYTFEQIADLIEGGL